MNNRFFYISILGFIFFNCSPMELSTPIVPIQFPDVSNNTLIFDWQYDLPPRIAGINDMTTLFNIHPHSISYNHTNLLNSILSSAPYTFNTKLEFTCLETPTETPLFFEYITPVLKKYTSIAEFLDTYPTEPWLITLSKALYMACAQKRVEKLIQSYPSPLVYRVKNKAGFDTQNGVNEKNEGVNFIGQIAEHIRADLLAQKLIPPVLQLAAVYETHMKNVSVDTLETVIIKAIPPLTTDAQKLSPFYASSVFIGGARYGSVQHYYEYMKYYFLEVPIGLLNTISRTEDPFEMFKRINIDKAHYASQTIAQQYENQSKWTGQHQKEAYAYAMLTTFLQHPDLAEILFGTGNTYLLFEKPRELHAYPDAFISYLLMAIRDLLQRDHHEVVRSALYTNNQPLSRTIKLQQKDTSSRRFTDLMPTTPVLHKQPLPTTKIDGSLALDPTQKQSTERKSTPYTSSNETGWSNWNWIWEEIKQFFYSFFAWGTEA